MTIHIDGSSEPYRVLYFPVSPQCVGYGLVNKVCHILFLHAPLVVVVVLRNVCEMILSALVSGISDVAVTKSAQQINKVAK